MKALAAAALALLFITVPADATNDFCMDCTHRFVLVGASEEVRQEASCCTTVDGHCYENDWVMETNVGFGCQVSEPDERGWTRCASNNNDRNCGGGGSGPTPQQPVIGDGGCKYDQFGWCDMACSSCSWG